MTANHLERGFRAIFAGMKSRLLRFSAPRGCRQCFHRMFRSGGRAGWRCCCRRRRTLAGLVLWWIPPGPCLCGGGVHALKRRGGSSCSPPVVVRSMSVDVRPNWFQQMIPQRTARQCIAGNQPISGEATTSSPAAAWATRLSANVRTRRLRVWRSYQREIPPVAERDLVTGRAPWRFLRLPLIISARSFLESGHGPHAASNT